MIYDPKCCLLLGVRMDVIRNVSVHDIYRARPALSECPYCKEMVIYRDHREHCKSRAKESEVADASAMRSEWCIGIQKHKTGSTRKIELVWSKVFLKMVSNFISKNGLKKNDKIFAKVR